MRKRRGLNYLCSHHKLPHNRARRLLERIEQQRERTRAIAQVQQLLEQERMMRSPLADKGRRHACDSHIIQISGM